MLNVCPSVQQTYSTTRGLYLYRVPVTVIFLPLKVDEGSAVVPHLTKHTETPGKTVSVMQNFNESKDVGVKKRASSTLNCLRRMV